MASDVQSLINYYARERYYRHIQTVCNEVLRKRGNDPVLVFWKAFGALMEVDATQDAIWLTKAKGSNAGEHFRGDS